MTRGSDCMRGEGVQVTRVVTEATLYTGIGTNGRCCAADKDKFSSMEAQSGCVGDKGSWGQGTTKDAGEGIDSGMLVMVLVTGWVSLVLRLCFRCGSTQDISPLPWVTGRWLMSGLCLTDTTEGERPAGLVRQFFSYVPFTTSSMTLSKEDTHSLGFSVAL